jgi:hypothetical protein
MTLHDYKVFSSRASPGIPHWPSHKAGSFLILKRMMMNEFRNREMSLDATRWAWIQSGLRSTDKIVLLSLADRSDENHCCYPSIKRLSNDTCLDRKTVIKCIQRLQYAEKIIADQRSGRSTKYTLIGVEDRLQQDAGK